MWRDIETGTVVTRHDEIRGMRPFKTLPANLTDEILFEEGFEVVQQTQPQFDPLTQRVDGEPTVSEVDGQWVQTWNIVDLPTEEVASTRQAAEADAWENIKAFRTRLQNDGVLVNGKWFQTDESSRIQYLSLIMMGANMLENVQWKTMDNTFVPMTPELVSGIFSAIAAQDQAIFGRAEQHRADMLASENPAMYSYTQGWPETFSMQKVPVPPDRPEPVPPAPTE